MAISETYSIYLASEAWDKKRQHRLLLSNRRCEACGCTEKLHVHHLTYERIFKEEMDDLMVLCSRHHEAIEELIRKGVVSRFGDVKEIRSVTMSFLTPRSKSVHKAEWRHAEGKPRKMCKSARKKAAAERRAKLIENPQVVTAIYQLSRAKFKSWVRKFFGNEVLSDAIYLYGQRKKLRALAQGQPAVTKTEIEEVLGIDPPSGRAPRAPRQPRQPRIPGKNAALRAKMMQDQAFRNALSFSKKAFIDWVASVYGADGSTRANAFMLYHKDPRTAHLFKASSEPF